MHQKDIFHVKVEGLNIHIHVNYPTFVHSVHNNRMHKFANSSPVVPEVVTLASPVGWQVLSKCQSLLGSSLLPLSSLCTHFG